MDVLGEQSWPETDQDTWACWSNFFEHQKTYHALFQGKVDMMGIHHLEW